MNSECINIIITFFSYPLHSDDDDDDDDVNSSYKFCHVVIVTVVVVCYVKYVSLLIILTCNLYHLFWLNEG